MNDSPNNSPEEETGAGPVDPSSLAGEGSPVGEESADPQGLTPRAAEPPRVRSGRLMLLASSIRRDWLGFGLRALVIVFLLIPAHDFLHVALAREWFPYEIEWLEGEVAMYGLRFRDHASIPYMYPDYENGQFVPQLYPPVFPMVLGTCFKLFSVRLGWGRLISLLATIGLLAAVVALVRHHTGTWFPGVVGALSYLMFYKVSGYWYDLVRVDSLAYCLALWSAFFILYRGGRWWVFAIGLVLAALAQFTKQTTLFIPAAAVGYRVCFVVFSFVAVRADRECLLLRRARPFLPRYPSTFMVLIPFLFVAGGLMWLATKTEYKHFLFYIYEVPSHHPIFWNTIRTRGVQELWQYYGFLVWIVPAAIWLPLATRKWPWPKWKVGFAALLIGALVTAGVAWWILAGRSLPHPGSVEWGRIRKPGLFSLIAFRYVAGTWTFPMILAFALSAAGLAVWCVRWTSCKTPLPGIFWILLLVPAQHVAAFTWVKIGGFANNFMSLFAVQSVALGIALAWLYRAARPRWTRHIITVLLLGILTVSWYGTRWPLEVRPREEKKLKELETAGALKSANQASTPSTTSSASDNTISLSYPQYAAAAGEYVSTVHGQNNLAVLKKWGPLIMDGLRYNLPATPLRPIDDAYGNQIPPKGWKVPWKALMARIRELNKDGGVYLPHQNFLGYLAGVPPGPSVDAIRDISYFKPGSPKLLLKEINEKHWRYIILCDPVSRDWVPNDIRYAIERNYREIGPVIPNVVNIPALRPRLGAQARPSWVYERKGQ